MLQPWLDYLDCLEDGQGEGRPPEDAAGGREVVHVDHGVQLGAGLELLGEEELQELHQQPDQEEEVGEQVVQVPEGQVALEKPPLRHWFRVLQLPKEVGCNVNKLRERGRASKSFVCVPSYLSPCL